MKHHRHKPPGLHRKMFDLADAWLHHKCFLHRDIQLCLLPKYGHKTFGNVVPVFLYAMEWQYCASVPTGIIFSLFLCHQKTQQTWYTPVLTYFAGNQDIFCVLFGTKQADSSTFWYWYEFTHFPHRQLLLTTVHCSDRWWFLLQENMDHMCTGFDCPAGKEIEPQIFWHEALLQALNIILPVLKNISTKQTKSEAS